MRHLVLVCVASISAASFADTIYLGLYLKGNQIGYSSYASTPCKLAGKPALRNDSRTVVDAGLMGSSMSVTMDSTTWTTPAGSPVKMLFDMESGGRSSKLVASFSGKSVLLDVSNGGVKTKLTLPLPTNAPVVDDPLDMVSHAGLKVGDSKSFYVLDSSTASLMKNTVHVVGSVKASIHGKAQTAKLIRLSDDRSATDVYVNRKWDILRVDGPMGIVMYPVSKATALKKTASYSASTDLSLSTSITPDKSIDDPSHLARLKLKIVGDNIGAVPSDEYQTASRIPGGWSLDIHPPKLADGSAKAISRLGAGKEEWLKPSLYIPCESNLFKALAAKIVQPKTDIQAAAAAIQGYVFRNMRPNAGIGVLRDATEVLSSKEGVCRDYATLTVTLLRAAGIPARLAGGLVSWDGTFYYHAWAEAWDGTRWFGVDSTTDDPQISASHIKLGEGNIETAFSFTFLDHARIQILEARKE